MTYYKIPILRRASLKAFRLRLNLFARVGAINATLFRGLSRHNDAKLRVSRVGDMANTIMTGVADISMPDGSVI